MLNECKNKWNILIYPLIQVEGMRRLTMSWWLFNTQHWSYSYWIVVYCVPSIILIIGNTVGRKTDLKVLANAVRQKQVKKLKCQEENHKIIIKSDITLNRNVLLHKTGIQIDKSVGPQRIWVKVEKTNSQKKKKKSVK